MSKKKKPEYPNGKHPNSLANLRSFTDADRANIAREKGLETRRKNKARRDAMQQALAAFKGLSEEEIPTGIDVLRVAMMEAMARDDADEVTRLAAIIAPYETPKLASKEVTVNDNLGDKSDDELAELVREFGLKEVI